MDVSGDEPVVRASLDEVEAHHRRALFEVAVGACKSMQELDVYVFQRARAGQQRTFWSTSSLYEALGLKTYKGLSSKWSHQKEGSWENAFRTHFGCSQLVYSNHIASDTTHRLQLPWPKRCLPSTSISCVGVLCLLARWSFLKKNNGEGPSSEEDALVAKELLSGLVQAACQRQAFHLSVCLTKVARMCWASS